jgi:hypothetical protein
LYVVFRGHAFVELDVLDNHLPDGQMIGALFLALATLNAVPPALPAVRV